MFRNLIVVGLAVCLFQRAGADDGLLGNDAASTARGDILESRGDLAESLGRGSLLRSMSATQLQEAIDKRLSNRKERVEMYYELKEIREEALEEDRLSASERRNIATVNAPDRLNENQIDRKTGEIYWPSPLDSDVLKPYRKPIEDTLDKRGQDGVTYRKWDYLKVHRIVKRIEEAVDSIKDKLEIREVVALKQYLEQIDYEARFDINDNRVDF